MTHRACAHTLDPAPRHPRMLRRSIARAAPQMDQKFLKCRRYSKSGSSVAVAQQLADMKAMFDQGLIPSREIYEDKARQILGLR